MSNAKKVTFWGIMSALALVLSLFESIISPSAVGFPGAKLGLSNVITVVACFSSGIFGAIYITVIKSVFALFTRGFLAFVLSFSGGLISALLTAFLLKTRLSIVSVSIISACCHNLAQVVMICLITSTRAYLYYLPVLIAFAVFSGTVTGCILKIIIPKFILRGFIDEEKRFNSH